MISAIARREPFRNLSWSGVLQSIRWFRPVWGARKFCIGRLLLRANLIQRHELNAALSLARQKRVLLGQALVESGVLSEESICQALRVQQLVREGAIEEKWAEMSVHLGLDQAVLIKMRRKTSFFRARI